MVNSKQRGVTLIGWLFLLTPMAIVLYAGVRIAPVYLNYMKVKRTVDQVSSELKGGSGATMREIQEALAKRMDIEGLTFPTVNDILVRREGTTWVIQAKYEDIAPLFANVSLLMQFDESRQIQ